VATEAGCWLRSCRGPGCAVGPQDGRSRTVVVPGFAVHSRSGSLTHTSDGKHAMTPTRALPRGKRIGGVSGDALGRPAPGRETALPNPALSADRQSAGDDVGCGGNAMMRFRFDVLMLGENRWASNHLRFADEHRALVHARGMSSRWIVIEKMRITSEGTPKEERYVSGSEHPDWAGPRVEFAVLNGALLRVPNRGTGSLRSRVCAVHQGDGPEERLRGRRPDRQLTTSPA
jgi:hypothetical protein